MAKGIRPTQDKVRKAIFDILGDISGLTFLELFAGSGAVGLEALSRGASELTVVESNRESMMAIKRNIELLKIPTCNLYNLKAEKAAKLLSLNKKSFDIIFIDPPYYKPKVLRPHSESNKGDSGTTANLQGQPLSKKILQTLDSYDILAPHGLIVVQHFKSEILPKDSLNFSLIKEAKYGDTWLSIYRASDK